MSFYRDFAFLGAGVIAGIYIEKNRANTHLGEKFDQLLYKIKPILRDVRDNILEIINNSNINFDFEEVFVNFKHFINIFKSKIEDLNKMESSEEKYNFIKVEIISLLNSIQVAFEREKKRLFNSKIVEIED